MSAWRGLREERRAGRRLARQIAVLVLRARRDGFASKLAPTKSGAPFHDRMTGGKGHL